MKRFLTLFLTLCITLSLIGCGKEQEDQNKSPAPEGGSVLAESAAPAAVPTATPEPTPTVAEAEPVYAQLNYRPTVIDTPEGLGTPDWSAIGANSLFVTGDDDGIIRLFALDLESGDWLDLSYANQFPSEEITGFAASEDCVFLLTQGGTPNEEGFVWPLTDVLTVFSTQTGELISRTNPATLFHYFFNAVGDKLICGEPDDGIRVLSVQGQTLHAIKPKGIAQQVDAIEGRAIVSVWDKDQVERLYELDVESGALTALWPEAEPLPIYASTSCSSQQGGLITNGRTLYRYDPDTGESEYLFDWLDYGVSSGPTVSMSVAGAIYVVSGGKLVEINPYDGPARRLITVLSGSGEMNKAIAKFNMESQDYVARLVSYPYGQDERMLTEISVGKGPDILCYNFELPGALEKVTPDGGLFTDLLPYIDADPTISREDFIPYALEGSIRHGRMYTLTPLFKSNTLSADKSVRQSVGEWNVEALFDLNSRLPADCTLFSYVYRDFLLNDICALASVEYVDFDNASCSFDDPSFARWLELTKTIRIMQWDEESIDNLLVNGSPLDFFLQKSAGRDYEILGFPGKDEAVTMVSPAYSYGIMACSPNKDGAWQLLRNLLSEDLQAYGYYLPAIASAMELRIQQEIDNKSYMKYYQVDFDREDAAKALAALKGAVLVRDTAISDIIRDEAGRYFEGLKSLESAVSAIQSRSSIFLAEQYG